VNKLLDRFPIQPGHGPVQLRQLRRQTTLEPGLQLARVCVLLSRLQANAAARVRTGSFTDARCEEL
jgi:hypothetical protein